MKLIRDFGTNEEIDEIITEMESQGAKLVETQYHFDGKHLVFELSEPDLVAEIDDLKTRVERLENK